MRLVFAFLIAFLLFVAIARADDYCFDEAGREFGVSPNLLMCYSQHESKGNQKVQPNRNTDGSVDVCHMQINSSWKNAVGKKYGRSRADAWWRGLADPCECTKAGAVILADCIKRHGLNWRGLGCYNAKSDRKRLKYSAALVKTCSGGVGH